MPGGITTHGCFDAVKMWMSGRQTVGLVERADADELHERARARVMAPHRDPAARAARDVLALAACRRRVDQFRFDSEVASTRSDSIIAFNAKAEPVSRWHQRQWQQCTKSGALAIR